MSDQAAGVSGVVVEHSVTDTELQRALDSLSNINLGRYVSWDTNRYAIPSTAIWGEIGTIEYAPSPVRNPVMETEDETVLKSGSRCRKKDHVKYYSHRTERLICMSCSFDPDEE